MQRNDLNAGRGLLCVVCPCYNEGEVVEHFYDALSGALEDLGDLDVRIVFVDDGSTDETLEKLNALAGRDDRVGVLSLSRNFGHQIAVTAGVDFARGDAMLIMDADLQHPPELIPEMVRMWRSGSDIVSAIRRRTRDASFFKRVSSNGFYWLVNRLSDTRIQSGVADFCLLSRRAQQALRSMPERHRFLRGMVSWMGFARSFVEYDAPERRAGRSKYTMRKMLRLAHDAVFSFSSAPIKAATKLGLVMLVLGCAYLAYVLFHYFVLGGLEPGWPSLLSVVLIMGGVQLAFLGVFGEYLARVFEEVKGRPLYFLKQSPAWQWPGEDEQTVGPQPGESPEEAQ